MSEDDATNDLANLERGRLRALVDRDGIAAAALHADDYELVTPGGRALSKTDYLDSITSGGLRYHRFEPISDIRIRLHDDTAILRYRVAIAIDWEGGAELGDYWHTDYWERRGGQWQAVWSHATRIGPLSAD